MKTIRPAALYALITLALAALLPGAALAIDISLEPNIGYGEGYTKYRLSVDDDGSLLESELEFPINGFLTGVRLNVNDLANQRPLGFEFNFRTNLTESTGKTEDTDWLDEVKFIYSRSDTDTRLWDVSARVTYTAFLSSQLKPGQARTRAYSFAGYRWQDFSFDVSNVDQDDVLGQGLYDANVSGPVLTYDITYHLFFVGGGFSVEGGRSLFELEGQVGGVYARDKDDHLLRYKRSEGSYTGLEAALLARYIYNISRHFYIKAGAEAMLINADGTHDQYFYGGTDEGLSFRNIDIEIRSAQYLAELGLGVRF